MMTIAMLMHNCVQAAHWIEFGGINESLFVSLGCDKNLVDSEVMLGLRDHGYSLTNDERNGGGHCC